MKYSHITIDFGTINDGLMFEDSKIISDCWQKFYLEYRVRSKLPDDKWSYIGSETSFGVTTWSKDVLEFAPAFHEYIMEIVKKYGKIDLLLAEYTNVMRKRKLMTMRETPYNQEEFDKLKQKQFELRYKIWDKDFSRKTDYEEGRIIPFK